MPQEYSYCPTEIAVLLVWHPVAGSDLQQMLQQQTKALGAKWQQNSAQGCPHAPGDTGRELSAIYCLPLCSSREIPIPGV